MSGNVEGRESSQKKPPKRGKTRDYARADVEVSRCPKCQSTEREPYFRRQVIEGSGEVHGRPFSAVILQWTCCRSCGQHRIDRSWKFLPEPKAA